MTPLINTKYIYRQVKEQILQEIIQGDSDVGSRLPTISEIAARHEVSRDTVLRSVKDLVREGILDSKRGRGITIRRIPKKMNNGQKLILSIERPSDGPILSKAVRLAIAQCIPGWQLFETPVDDENSNFFSPDYLDELIKSQNYGAYLLCSVPIELKRYFEKRKLPCVVGGELEDGVDLPNVCCDEYERFYQGTRYLLECGYPRVVLIQHAHRSPGDYEREAGVTAAYSEKSISNGLMKPQVIEIDESDEAIGRKIISEFIDAIELPAGIISCSDIVSCWILQMASEKGISVSDQLGIVTNGRTELPTHTNPQITSLRYDHVKLGFATGKMLGRITSGYEPEPRHLKIPFERPYVITRQTTIKFNLVEQVK